MRMSLTDGTRSRLLDCIQNDRAPHAFLIAGPDGSGKRELARRAAAMYCLSQDAPERLSGCPNYFEVGEAVAKVDDVRGMLSLSTMQGFNGGRRAFVLIDAHRMSQQIQNTLLKTLEEPRPDTLLILTGSEFGLLPTIRSRCVILRLGAEPIDLVQDELLRAGMSASDARLYAVLSDGIPGRARLFRDEAARSFRQEALHLLEGAMFSHAPFQEASELVTAASENDEEELPSSEEASAKGGKKKKRVDPSLTLRLLGIWESVVRDALLQVIGVADLRNRDAAVLVNQIAARFTIARLQGIIELLAKAQLGVASGANGSMTLDTILAGLYEKESR